MTRRGFLGAVASSLTLAACGCVRGAPGRVPFDGEDPAFGPDPEGFSLMGRISPGDWLAVHPEPDEAFEHYLARGPRGPTAARTRLYLQPLGAFDDDGHALLAKLRVFGEAYFDLPFVLAAPRALPTRGSRVRGARRPGEGAFATQYLTRTILDEVLEPALEDDAIACLGVTMEDLYPGPGWGFVFGQASLARRIGVHSAARFFPAFAGEPSTEETLRRGLLRACKVLAHETGHMFSITHCVRLRCVMNGSNSLPETDRAPLHLCPICLEKLQWNLRFGVRARYARLEALYRREGFEAEARWVAARRARIGER